MASIKTPEFNYLNTGQAIAQGNQNALAQMKMQQMPEQLQMQRDNNKNSLAANKMNMEVQGLKYLSNSAQMVNDQDTYRAWSQDMVSKGLVPQGMLNPNYTPEYMNQIMGRVGEKMGRPTASIQNYEFDKNLKTQKEKDRFADMRRNQYKIVDIAGVKTRVPINPGGESTPLSTLQEEAGAAGEIKKSEKIGANTGTRIDKAIQLHQNTKQNIRNLKTAAEAVEAGAETGAIAKLFPSLRSETIKLNNMQSQLGLDVVGAVTFGALSKGELDLAKAVALPTGLDEPELLQWIKDKISAQEKLADYFERQAIYLSKPGNTAASWMEDQRASSQSTSIDDLVNKYAD